MTDQSTPNGTPQTNKPTQKMVDFATNIAKRLGEPLPPDALSSFDECRAYLDSKKDTGMRPTDKQLSFAQAIAGRTGSVVPETALCNGKELSKWIDANK